MSATSQHERPGTTQFGLRALLAALTVLAIACAIAAPVVRSLTPGQRGRLLAVVGTFVFGSGGMVLASVWMRQRIVRRAGTVLLDAPLTTVRSMRGLILSAVFNSGYVLWMASQMVMVDGPWWALAIALLLCVTGGFQATLSLLHLLWRNAMVSIAFCEKGLVINSLQFQPWEALAGCRWDFERGYIWYPNSKYYANGYKLPAELRDEADRIMREHLSPPVEASVPRNG